MVCFLLKNILHSYIFILYFLLLGEDVGLCESYALTVENELL